MWYYVLCEVDCGLNEVELPLLYIVEGNLELSTLA